MKKRRDEVLFKKAAICIFILIIIFFLIWELFGIKEIVLKKIYPLEFCEYVYMYSEDNNIDPMLIFAIIKNESNFNHTGTSKAEARGLMQLMEETAKEVAGKIGIIVTTEDLYEPQINIQIGTRYVADLIKNYDGNISIALAAYNAGMGTVQKWLDTGIIKKDGSDIENIPYRETNNYVRKILRDYKIYNELYIKE